MCGRGACRACSTCHCAARRCPCGTHCPTAAWRSPWLSVRALLRPLSPACSASTPKAASAWLVAHPLRAVQMRTPLSRPSRTLPPLCAPPRTGMRVLILAWACAGPRPCASPVLGAAGCRSRAGFVARPPPPRALACIGVHGSFDVAVRAGRGGAGRGSKEYLSGLAVVLDAAAALFDAGALAAASVTCFVGPSHGAVEAPTAAAAPSRAPTAAEVDRLAALCAPRAVCVHQLFVSAGGQRLWGGARPRVRLLPRSHAHTARPSLLSLGPV